MPVVIPEFQLLECLLDRYGGTLDALLSYRLIPAFPRVQSIGGGSDHNCRFVNRLRGSARSQEPHGAGWGGREARSGRSEGIGLETSGRGCPRENGDPVRFRRLELRSPILVVEHGAARRISDIEESPR